MKQNKNNMERVELITYKLYLGRYTLPNSYTAKYTNENVLENLYCLVVVPFFHRCYTYLTQKIFILSPFPLQMKYSKQFYSYLL